MGEAETLPGDGTGGGGGGERHGGGAGFRLAVLHRGAPDARSLRAEASHEGGGGGGRGRRRGDVDGVWRRAADVGGRRRRLPR